MIGEFVSAREYAELLSRGKSLEHRQLSIDEPLFRASYNRHPFELTHRLHEHDRFSLPSLFELVRRLPESFVVCRPGLVPDGADFDSSFRPDSALDLEDALGNLESRRAYVYARNPEADPGFRPLIRDSIAEIAAHVHDLDGPITWYSTYLFISAQGSVTPYHMDREMNFLLQIRGTKQVQLWDPADPEVLTEFEKDRLLSYSGARPPLRPATLSRARKYGLRPGSGVHHPFIAPHLVHTESELSVSLAVTFRTRRSDTWTKAHQMNHHLRRLGLHPKPVGTDAWRDALKANALSGAERTRAALRGITTRH
jgi:Cupin-like domain